jgi:hypothetical protein
MKLPPPTSVRMRICFFRWQRFEWGRGDGRTNKSQKKFLVHTKIKNILMTTLVASIEKETELVKQKQVDQKGNETSLRVRSKIQAPFIVFQPPDEFLPISKDGTSVQKLEYYDALYRLYQSLMYRMNNAVLLSLAPIHKSFEDCYSVRMLEIAVASAITHQLMFMAAQLQLGALIKKPALELKRMANRYLKPFLDCITYAPLSDFLKDSTMYQMEEPLHNMGMAPLVMKTCKELHRFLPKQSPYLQLPDLTTSFPYLRAKFFLLYSQLQLNHIQDNIMVQQIFLSLDKSDWAKYDDRIASMIKEVQSFSQTVITQSVNTTRTQSTTETKVFPSSATSLKSASSVSASS